MRGLRGLRDLRDLRDLRVRLQGFQGEVRCQGLEISLPQVERHCVTLQGQAPGPAH